MRKLKIFLLMAGEGKRFQVKGFDRPKSLIEFENKPLFMHALDSVRALQSNSEIFYVIRNLDKAHFKQHHGEKLITIQQTRGPLESALVSSQILKEDCSVIFLDCDLFFNSKGWENCILNNHDVDGAIPYFINQDSKYSHIIHNEGLIKKIEEKTNLSEFAVCGAYFFKSIVNFRSLAELALENIKSEPFISAAIAEGIKKQQNFQVFSVEEYASFGTPEELKDAKLNNEKT